MDDTDNIAFDFQPDQNGRGRLILRGRLDRETTASIWRPTTHLLRHTRVPRLLVQADQVVYCDGAGVALLDEYRRIQKEHRGQIEIQGLPPQCRQLMALFGTDQLVSPPPVPGPVTGFIRGIGERAAGSVREVVREVSFTGEVFVKLVRALARPRTLRWRDTLVIAEKTGPNALGITGALGFLIGLILAFQSAAAMRQFGAEIFVADLVVVVLFRELGPLITAVLLTSRSASAFAAELGTMKVNEEIDALVTLGLDPVQFLVLPRIIAVLCVIPLLTVFNQLFGLIGCGLVMSLWNVPTEIYLDRIRYAATLTDFFGGLVKTFFFGALVAGIGCLRGLQTRTGPTAVGDATTRAVVNGIVAIIAVDGVFAVVYYVLGI
ncbi:MAG: MlaE family lipid ABC transporter permease subunit [Planctomycetes bacterium]|nr:MlaE family lipid ABC transporter permease subunit [Planctomycetota bacterium]